eukprot:CAMPEP_0197021342 /NCGR_PEP_ID=MMETSP1384-20130603/2210_1 /TAXON_ID=29189 /ORGANISM="Ammonia sp." /LENGTH=325 /DNA_ID=CAMNT_0042449149 /DNA_START=89 /DNA_END=1066 /DNA_ORIENTATION=+
MSSFLQRFGGHSRAAASTLHNVSVRRLTDRSFRLVNLLDIRAGRQYQNEVSSGAYHPFIRTAQPDREPDLERQVLLDIRKDPDAYKQGHIKGAVHLSRERFDFYDYIDTKGGILYHQVYEAMKECGVGNDYSDIVLYDNAGECACRLWYVLRYFGFSNVKILNGGYQHWVKAGLPQDTEPVSPKPAKELSLKPTRSYILTRPTQMLEDHEHRRSQIIDTRSPEEFKLSKIPRAINIPAAKFMKDGYFRPVQDIRGVLRAEGFDVENNSKGHIIVYSDKGRSSSIGYFCISMVGFERVSLYDQGIANWEINQERKLTPDQTDAFSK